MTRTVAVKHLPADTKVHGVDYTIAGLGTMSKTDYDLVCWNTQADGKGTDYAVGATYVTDEPLALYAKWLAVDQYVKLSSTDTFTLKVYDSAKHWDGTLQYSTDAVSWNEWDGTGISSSTGKVLYLRGSGNTVITGNGFDFRWVLTSTGGASISCTGNIETLLDCSTVATDGHPTMGESCYYYMFYNCTKLTSTPTLPEKTLGLECSIAMCYGCSSIKLSETQTGDAYRIP